MQNNSHVKRHSKSFCNPNYFHFTQVLEIQQPEDLLVIPTISPLGKTVDLLPAHLSSHLTKSLSKNTKFCPKSWALNGFIGAEARCHTTYHKNYSE